MTTEILLTLLIFNVIINILLLGGYLRLRSIMNAMDLEKYKNCIVEMMKVKAKFEEVSTQRIREISLKINELEEVLEVCDDKIIEAQEATIDKDRI